MKEINTTWTHDDWKWAIMFYASLAAESKEAGRPDLAELAIKCAEKLKQEGWRYQNEKQA